MAPGKQDDRMLKIKTCAIKSVIMFGIGLCLFPVIIESRQMCWTCQFLPNGPGAECMTEPVNWTMGYPRMRCPTKCIITAEYDAASGAPTFFYRGCGESSLKDGCENNGAKHSCYYSCENKDYCNDKSLPVSPLVEDDTDGASSLPGGHGLVHCALLSFLAFLMVKYVVLLGHR